MNESDNECNCIKCVLSKRLKERHSINNVRTYYGYNVDNDNWDRDTCTARLTTGRILTGRNCICNVVNCMLVVTNRVNKHK